MKDMNITRESKGPEPYSTKTSRESLLDEWPRVVPEPLKGGTIQQWRDLSDIRLASISRVEPKMVKIFSQ